MANRAVQTTGESSDWRTSEKIYYRIGEVSRITGIKPYVLRYWESEFSLMAPAKSRSKQRLYRKRDIETILLIKKLLYDQKFTIAGAKKKLRERSREPAETREVAATEVTPTESQEETPQEKGQMSLGLADTASRENYRMILKELKALRELL